MTFYNRCLVFTSTFFRFSLEFFFFVIITVNVFLKFVIAFLWHICGTQKFLLFMVLIFNLITLYFVIYISLWSLHANLRIRWHMQFTFCISIFFNLIKWKINFSNTILLTNSSFHNSLWYRSPLMKYRFCSFEVSVHYTTRSTLFQLFRLHIRYTKHGI